MIIAIVGPTAVGKTKLSVALAKKYHAEIINCDAMQVYRGLNIGTAKITEEETEGIPHHLFDICDVTEPYTVFEYQRDCREKIKQLEENGTNIILVGGTGLYLKAVLYDYCFEPNGIEKSYDALSSEELYLKIKQVNPALEIHPNNRKRLVRYWNKIENNSIEKKTGQNKQYEFIVIGLTTSRENLYQRIHHRVDHMIEEGLLEEVKFFYDQNINSKALLTGIGYKELYLYYQQQITLPEALECIKKNSRHYAKRQYTFFNNQLDVSWFETNYQDFNITIDEVETFLQQQKNS